MNIRTVQCPSCGGNLNVESVNQSLIYCMYCGASVSLETNHNKGYDMELGRLDARAEMADQLLGKIEKIKPELIRNSNAEHDTKYYPGRINDLKLKLSMARTGGWKEYLLKPFGMGLLVLFIGAFIIVALSSKLNHVLLVILEYLVGGAPIYFPVIGLIIKFKKQGEIKEHIKYAEASLEEARRLYNETEEFIRKNAEVDIPPRFRQESALEYIIKGLKAREFISLEQAFFRCEEAMARGEVRDSYI